MEFIKESVGEHGESHGTAKLYVDDEVVAEDAIRTQTGHFTLCGDGLCVGRDAGDAGQQRVPAAFAFSGGTIVKVVFDVGDDAYLDLERQLAAAMARD